MIFYMVIGDAYKIIFCMVAGHTDKMIMKRVCGNTHAGLAVQMIGAEASFGIL